MYILVNSCAVNKALSVLSKYQKIIDSSSPKYYYYFVIYFVQTLYTIQNLLQMLLQIISKSTKKKNQKNYFHHESAQAQYANERLCELNTWERFYAKYIVINYCQDLIRHLWQYSRETLFIIVKPPQPVHQTNFDGVNIMTQDTLAPRLNDQRFLFTEFMHRASLDARKHSCHEIETVTYITKYVKKYAKCL